MAVQWFLICEAAFAALPLFRLRTLGGVSAGVAQSALNVFVQTVSRQLAVRAMRQEQGTEFEGRLRNGGHPSWIHVRTHVSF